MGIVFSPSDSRQSKRLRHLVYLNTSMRRDEIVLELSTGLDLSNVKKYFTGMRELLVKSGKMNDSVQ